MTRNHPRSSHDQKPGGTLLIPALFFLLPFSAISQNRGSYYDTSFFNGRINSYGVYDSSKKCWLKYHLYYTGEISSVTTIDPDDFTSGSLTAFHENGNIAFFTTTKKGRKYGRFEEYYPDGKIKCKGGFYNGFRSGKWKEYYPDGKLSAEYAFTLSSGDSIANKQFVIGGVPDSTVTAYTVKTGTVDSSLGTGLASANLITYSFLYFRSTPSGTWKTYDRHGKLISKAHYPAMKKEEN